VPRQRYEESFAPRDLTTELLNRIERLAPFGVGNPQPMLRVGPLRLQAPPRGFGANHLGLVAAGADGARVDLVAWGWGERPHLFEGEFEVVGRLDMDSYLGRPVLRIADARPVAAASDAAAAAAPSHA